jgi:hypothetical protein
MLQHFSPEVKPLRIPDAAAKKKEKGRRKIGRVFSEIPKRSEGSILTTASPGPSH